LTGIKAADTNFTNIILSQSLEYNPQANTFLDYIMRN
jgi:hypothetical protein